MKGTKPYFIKKLPARVELLEGQGMCVACQVGRGCKPWFIKKLNSKVEVIQGQTVEVKCLSGPATDEQITSMGSTNVLAKVVRREGQFISLYFNI